MNEIVQIDGKHSYTTSLIIAEGVGLRHRAVMELLKKYENDFVDLGTCPFETYEFKTKGPIGSYYRLDEEQATFLMTLFRNNTTVVLFKKLLVKAFFKQQRINASVVSNQNNTEWMAVRVDGKLTHRKKTDTVKRFSEYCDANGSKSSFRYYERLATMENKALFIIEQEFKNVRDALSTRQLDLTISADIVIEKALDDGMEQGLYYKDIYKLAKNRVEAFTVLMGRSPVHEMLEAPQLKLEST